jgi:hypothetical protein
MRLRKLVVVGLVGFVSFAANIATAEEAVAPTTSVVGADGVNFTDLSNTFGPGRFSLVLREGEHGRFTNLAKSSPPSREFRDDRSYELAVTASAPAGIDVAFAQRGGVGFNAQGDIERASNASELRLGRGLRGLRRNGPSATPVWYIFAAAEDEALVWQPGTRNEFGGSGSSVTLQDRVEIGDIQAGITYEHNGLQASLAYVEREISATAGRQTVHQNQEFVGLTLTMRN